MTDEQVRTAIVVLRAYADGTLRTDLCDELDEAVEAAWLAYAESKDFWRDDIDAETDRIEQGLL